MLEAVARAGKAGQGALKLLAGVPDRTDGPEVRDLRRPGQGVAGEQVPLIVQVKNAAPGVTRHREGDHAGEDGFLSRGSDDVSGERRGVAVGVVNPYPGIEVPGIAQPDRCADQERNSFRREGT